MKEQSFEHHTRFQPLQHFVWLPLSVLLLISTVVYSVVQFVKNGWSIHLIWIIAIVVLAIIPGMLARMYALTLQDRLIRTEEQLRYFMLTGRRLDDRISLKQLIALRFASDDELIALVDRAISENLSPEEIKRSIQRWRADHQRV